MFDKRRKKLKQMSRNQKKPTSMIAATKPNSRVAEQFKTIRTNIQFSMATKNLQTILFSSSGPLKASQRFVQMSLQFLQIKGSEYL